MTRQRLRGPHSPAQLAALYPKPHDHRRWKDHHLRVEATIAVAKWLAGDGVTAAADLSCGNGSILRAVPAQIRYFGDFAAGYNLVGPIADTLDMIPAVDLFVCSETLEHVDDPDGTLRQIRGKADQLVLSTPVDAWNDDNPEHYWAWSREDVEEMAVAAGWRLHVFSSVDFRPMGLPYCFGIWGLK